ncbi:MAG: O-antigen ligase family protein [Chloroflexi bacterium]|nr:O-antigen ligase family protein [Chloroflexota bacterium]
MVGGEGSGKETPIFWKEWFLPGLLPLLIGLAFGVASSWFVVNGPLSLAIMIAVLVPFVVLLISYPFVVLMIWLLVMPFFLEQSSTMTALVYWGLHRAAIPAALSIAVIGDWLNLRKRRPVRFGPAEMFMVLFLLMALLNIMVLHKTGARALIDLYDFVIIPFCAYWLVRLFAPTRNDLQYLSGVALIVVVTQVVIGLVGWFEPHMLPASWVQMSGGRTTGTFRNPDPYSVTLMFMSLLLLQFVMQRAGGLLRTVSLFVVGLGFFGTFFSFSRACWLGGALVLIGLMFVYPKAMLRLILGMVLLVFVLGTTVLSREMAWVQTRLTEERQVENRIVVYAASLKLIEAEPLFGWGYGNHNIYAERFKERVGDIPEEAGERIASHNSNLTIMAEMGIPGFLLYMLPVAYWLLLSLKVWPRLPRDGFLGRTFLVILWLSLMEQFVVSNFDNLFSNFFFVTVLWWMYLGLIANLVWPQLDAVGSRQRRPFALTEKG